MAKLKINRDKIGKRAWGSVSKSQLGSKLARAYTAGDATKSQIREVYAYVPGDAFDEDSDGNPTFAHTKAWGPHHEVIGEEIVLNRNGVHALSGALSGARSKPSLNSSQLAEAKRHARKHYRDLEEDVPESLREALLGPSLGPSGTDGEHALSLEELTRGSREYEIETIRQAFRAQFNPNYESRLYVVETFDDYVIAGDWSGDSELAAKVTYESSDEGYTFASRDDWEVVMVTYEGAGETEESVGESAGADVPLEEVRGSWEYAMRAIHDAFRAQFNPNYESRLYVVETFDDYVIVTQWGESELAEGEYWKVTYQAGDEGYTFAERDAWEKVELAYQPAMVSTATEEGKNEPKPGKKLDEQKPARAAAPNSGDKSNNKRPAAGKGKRLEERVDLAEVELLESQDDGLRRIRVKGAMTAGIVNGNGRRYGRPVVIEALQELREHLHESPGQGRAIQLLGEAEHPSGKASRRPNLLETVTKWNDVSLDGDSVDLGGHIVETSKGKDILALAEAGVGFGVSMRGYGKSEPRKEGDKTIEEVLELHITGFDLVLDPSFENAALVESLLQDDTEDEMDPEKLKELIEQHPDLFKGLLEGKLEEASADQLKKIEGIVREKLGISEDADMGKELTEAAEARKELAERRRIEMRDKAVQEMAKDLKYGKLNEQFQKELAEAAKEGDGSNVKELAEGLRGRYDAFMSAAKLAGMGYKGKGIEVIGPVIEDETGVPEFARASFEITEALVARGKAKRRDYRNRDLNANEAFAARYMKRFDEAYRVQLAKETRELEEAEQSSDLNLPYSVSRAVMAEAIPQLVATGVFDVDTIDASPTLLWFETFVGETGYTATVTDEAVTADHGVWVALANKALTPGTVVVTNSAATVTYVEGTDYVIDYAGGRLMALSTGDITDSQALLADYGYTAIRKGEMATIERAKITLASKTITASAVRLATQISDEAVVFSRSQLGWDATARTLVSLINQVNRKIDQGLFYLALAAALQVANNSGGTWNSAGSPPDYDQFVRFVGSAKVKIANRFYEPQFLLLSKTNSDLIAGWQGFTQAGSRPDSDLNINGYAGRVKGLPVVDTVNFSDGYGLTVNREIVQHRVYQPMILRGPFQSHDATTGELLAAEEWYSQEYNASETLLPEKAAYVVIT